MTSVAVLGGGAWGTALALTAVWAGRKTILWSKDKAVVEEIKIKQENSTYLPGIALPPSLRVTPDLQEALASDIILLVVPAQVVRSVLMTLRPMMSSNSYIILCSKGIEMETGFLMHEVMQDVLPHHSASILSGPTFARDVALKQPTAATLAHHEITTSRYLSASLSSAYFRLYPSDDIMGVAIGGAIKNVIAIAAGIATAENFGDSTRAALITRGLAEMTRLGLMKGAKAETFLGLSGVGDLILSCTSMQSRNMALGTHLAAPPSSSPEKKPALTEGAFTAKAAHQISSLSGIEMPISEAVYKILYTNASIPEEIANLLARPLKKEY